MDDANERVVLVSVRAGAGSKPRRKVAIALPPENDYQVFAERVRRKLNLAGIAGIFHAETNIPVHNLAELQDIDDLVVEEGEPQPLPPSATSHLRSPAHKLGGTSARKGSLARTGSNAESGLGAENDDDKYAKKGNPLYRLFVQVAPENMLRSNSGSTSGLLPVTTKDVGGGGGGGGVGAAGKRGRKPRADGCDPRKLLLLFALMSCMATMMLLYSRISMGPALSSFNVLEPKDHLVSSETLHLGTSERRRS